MIKLKRCPFCGGEAEISVKHDFHWKPLYFEPHCKNEYCQGYAGRAYESKKLAISMWNTRTPEIVRCGECEHYKAANNKIGVCDLQIDMVNTDYFCSYGERREEDDKKK